MIYLAGSLRNPNIPKLTQDIEKATDIAVFSDWFAAGPEADDHWKTYYSVLADTYDKVSTAEKYMWALKQPASINTYLFDKKNIDAAKVMVLTLPAGKSGHLELGYFVGTGRPGIIMLDEDDVRWDVMYQFCHVVCNFDQLIDKINEVYPYEPFKVPERPIV